MSLGDGVAGGTIVLPVRMEMISGLNTTKLAEQDLESRDWYL